MSSSSFSEKRVSQVIIGLLVFMHITGLPVTIMEPDGALYAGIAKYMVQHHDYWNLFADGHDWLDKPHFPFWMMAISFNLLGFTTVAYKLPALLFLMVGVIYTYRFAYALYGEQVARWAVCILLTAEHLVISSNDVRAEPYLTGLIIASVYHLYRRQGIHLVLGALFAACAVMTKGPFALVPIGCAIAGQYVFTRQWRELFHLRWLLVTVLIGIFILPELYALYLQFDLHPEKIVFGHTGVSGIRFFFWDSQFGRFMNTGPIKGQGDPFFFFHTVLWAFLPWSIFLYAAVIAFMRKDRREFYTISGSLATFVLFSLSSFQLPHYLNIIFPFFAILTAQYILSLKKLKFFRITQYVIISIMGVAIIGLWALYQPAINYLAVGLIVIVVILFIWLPLKGQSQVFFRTCLASLALNIFLNGMFYPDVLQYQSGSSAAFYANRELKGQPIGFYKWNSYATTFYLDAPLERYDNIGTDQSVLLFTTPEYRDSLVLQGHPCRVIQSFSHFPVTKLDLPFVNHVTRKSAVEERLIIFVDKVPPTILK
ncbi:4-amino-4-deoxy-L-arabinose transferase [Chitinophaga sp. CF118]|uniref:ArnT family glycosyltransferase n=1 Tax=Chitinophaga sp. CF118 TaxID=1884367 RepID=UPI0008ED8E66|nr:glycosyltransferase family 39 protein [Chitinophaga sp. CF118]SFD32049.1 4-amino-4-deoxy-L-arabinose transferase [Chitinophaga sp. CF118]